MMRFLIEIRSIVTMWQNLRALGVDPTPSGDQTSIEAETTEEAVEAAGKRLVAIYQEKFPPWVFNEDVPVAHFQLKTEGGEIVSRGAVDLLDGDVTLYK